MRTIPLVFGHDSHLVGTLARPDVLPAGHGRPGILFLNSGFVHRVGAHGLYTAFARVIAEAGYPTLRFDYAGTGESRRPRGMASARAEQLLMECRAAIDELSTQAECRHVVLIGLCSGADDAHQVSMAEPRVVGMIQLDGHSTITAGFIIRFLARRIFSPHIFSPRRWAVFVKRVMGTDNSKHKNTVDDMDFFEMPDRNTLASDLSHLIARNVRLFYVYSDGANTYYNHRGQLRRGLASVDFGEALTECLIPSANHMFSGLSERTILFEHVLTWLAEGWPLQDNETPHV